MSNFVKLCQIWCAMRSEHVVAKRTVSLICRTVAETAGFFKAPCPNWNRCNQCRNKRLEIDRLLSLFLSKGDMGTGAAPWLLFAGCYIAYTAYIGYSSCIVHVYRLVGVNNSGWVGVFYLFSCKQLNCVSGTGRAVVFGKQNSILCKESQQL